MDNNTSHIENTNITKEMRDCYIDYAMSVIIGRALPDVRDGMKPVHRRILYAMHELGLTPDRQFRKCVRIVGDVLGKFHPHGDTAVYEALTRMAQDFSTRYPTVMGHGNFGSIDGDSPAAMRYTEAKMDYISSEMLRDINKNTVDFIDNFDGSEMEPQVLTARFPHLLVNGSSGIAVGMATNMPPHNLGETIDATIAYINKPNITINELLKKLPGPDFPTGGIINGKEQIYQSYETGTGKLKVRGKAYTQKAKRGKTEIIITELPYQVNKSKLIEKIASLQHQKKIEGITEIRDESDLKQGVRIVIEVRKGINPNILLNQLYKFTELEKPFGVINLALVPDDNGNLHPRILPLKEILHEYVKHQQSVIIRRTEFDLKKAQNRAHIVEGLLLALDNIDEIISIIRHSQNTKTASQKIMKRFKLSEIQTQAILDMRLQRLVGLERKKLKDEYNALLKQIKEFEKILSSEKEVDKVIIKELREIKKNYNDKRRTEIVDEIKEVEPEEIVIEKELNTVVTDKGFINSTTGRQKTHQIDEDDILRYDFDLSNMDSLVFITSEGKAYQLKGVDIPDIRGKGRNVKSIFKMKDKERIVNVLPVKDFDTKEELILATKSGQVKKIKLKELDTLQRGGVSIIGLKGKDDELISVVPETKKDMPIILATKKGYGIQFKSDSVRSMGRTAAGVKGINLDHDDELIGMIGGAEDIITVSEDGFIKKFPAHSLNLQSRAGRGLKIAPNTQKLIKILKGNKTIDEVILRTDKLEKAKVSKISKRTDKGTQAVSKEVADAFTIQNET